MEQKLADIFAALNTSDIPYCLLRGYDELTTAEHTRELDLLIAADHLPAFARLAERKSFVSLPSWGYAPHHFYVAYEEANDVWLKLDVVTEIRFGQPIRNLSTDLAEECLAGRQINGSIYILSPAEEFLTLLLHCLLDKATFRTEHRARLKALRMEADANNEIDWKIRHYIEQYLHSPIAWSIVAQSIDKEGWQQLLSLRSAVAQYFFWQQPVRNALRVLSGRLLRQLRPLFFTLRRRGLSVALLAPDGAGKTTLSKNLAHEDYIKARLIYMGSNLDSNIVGLPTTIWLKKKVKALNHKKLSLKSVVLKALNFINRLFEQWYRSAVGFYHKWSGKFVIFDRYVYDSYLAASTTSRGKRLRRWFLRSSCPAPDLVILLDAPGALLFQRKGEHSPEILERQRQVFLSLKAKLPNMVVVDASRSTNEVRRRVTHLIWQRYGNRSLLKETNGRDRSTINNA